MPRVIIRLPAKIPAVCGHFCVKKAASGGGGFRIVIATDATTLQYYKIIKKREPDASDSLKYAP